ncbi:MAG: DUF1697 domain-containing protein [Burkholderiales bacterium]|nr:DUF1697 domain-containing protein [Burkholderiales bacterium]MDE1925737.1 DUF1697 domain-containing protein [Burkholderiales bacterium]MDE2157985.1 DUF1697 domain-containing protein [Burkholderiales bacterium]MDE2502573.1 DUF1697 domain-containing protein [Burkholderiales bacterium]
MPRCVALFRGINVGPAQRLAMADLRALFVDLGYAGVRTLLNSGNVIFDAPRGTAAAHGARIRAAVAQRLGVDALVVVKSAAQIGTILRACRLEARLTDPTHLLVLLGEDPQALHGIAAIDGRVQVGAEAAYLWCEGGVLAGRTGADALRGQGGSATTRNWATLEKIQVLMEEGR